MMKLMRAAIVWVVVLFCHVDARGTSVFGEADVNVRNVQLYETARVSADFGERDRALALLDELLARVPTHRAAVSLREKVAAFAGDPKEARTWIERAAGQMAGLPPKDVQRSDWVWQKHKIDQLRARAGNANGGRPIYVPGETHTSASMAIEQAYIGDLAGSRATIALLPESISRNQALGELAMVEADRGEFDFAWKSALAIGSMEHTYDQSLKYRVAAHIARTQARMGDAAAAYAMQKNFDIDGAGASQFPVALAEGLIEAGDVDRAQEILREAEVNHSLGEGFANSKIAGGLAKRGSLREAFEVFSALQGEKRMNSFAGLAHVLGVTGSVEGLRFLIDKEHVPAASDELAMILAERGEVEAALASASLNNDVSLFRRMGEARLARGDKPGAARFFRRVVDLVRADPTDRRGGFTELVLAAEAQSRAGDLAGRDESYALAQTLIKAITHPHSRSFGWRFLAENQAKSGLIKDAQKSVESGGGLEQSADAIQAIAFAQFSAGNEAGALATARTLGRPSTWYELLGASFGKQGKTDDVERLASKLESRLDRASLYAGVARGLLERCGRYGFAWERYSRQSGQWP